MSKHLRSLLPLSLLLLATVVPSAHGAAGDLDKGFATGGTAVRDFGGYEDAVVDVVVQRDRKVIALVGIQDNPDRVAVMRLLKNGRLDRSFGDDGVQRIDAPGSENPGGMALSANGRIVISFTSDAQDAPPVFGVARLRPNGELDDTLDLDGIQTAGFGTGFTDLRASDVVLDGNRIIVTGTVRDNSGSGNDFALARFSSSGELDAAFSGDGRQTTDFDGQTDAALAADIDSQGRIVAVGVTAPPGPGVDPIAIARYDTEGELDPTFSEDGRLISLLAPEGRDVVVQPNDRIVVIGGVAGDFLVARFTEGGDPDPTFSGDGAQHIDFDDGPDTATAVTLAGSKLVVAGFARTPKRGRDFGIARLRSNGTLDGSFWKDGFRVVDFEGREDNAYAVDVDRTGDIVAGGSAQKGRDRITAVLRLNG